MNRQPGHLFIYGTLLAVSEHPLAALLRDRAERVGTGSIRARLYMIEEEDAQGYNIFPGAVPSAYDEDRVFGEVWNITDPGAVYPAFDAYENCGPDWPQPNEFLLRPVDVRLDQTARDLRCRAYLYTWDVTRARHVPSGRFTERAPQTR